MRNKIFRGLLIFQDLYQVACGERDIRQGGVFGDGESGKFGDEEKEESRWLRKFMKIREKCFCIFSPQHMRLGLK